MANRLDHIPFPRPKAEELHKQTGETQLHNLYVIWAMQHLKTATECTKALCEDSSNCHANDMGQALHAKVVELVLTNPAYMEAAARLMIHEEPPPDERIGHEAEEVS